MIVRELARAVLEQVEDHAFVDRLTPAFVAVPDLAQLCHRLGDDPGLLAHLARGRLDLALIAIRMPLGKPEHIATLAAAAFRDDHDDLVVPDDDPSGGEVLAVPAGPRRLTVRCRRSPIGLTSRHSARGPRGREASGVRGLG